MQINELMSSDSAGVSPVGACPDPQVLQEKLQGLLSIAGQDSELSLKITDEVLSSNKIDLMTRLYCENFINCKMSVYQKEALCRNEKKR